MGLKLRLIVVLMIPLALVVGVYGFFRVSQERTELIEDNEENLATTMKAIQIAVENALHDRALPDVHRLVSQLVQNQNVVDRVRLFNRELTPIIVSTRRPLGADVPRDAIRRVFETGESRSVTRRDAKPPALYSFAPIHGNDGRVVAVMEILQLPSAVEDRVRAAYRDIGIRLAILLVSVAALTAVVLQREVLRPLSRLLDGIRRLGHGHRGAPLTVDRRDEFGEVANAFNAMADSLEAAREKIAAETERTLDLEQQLRQAETLAVAGKLATSFAHEVGTPLNIISGRAEFVLNRLPAGDPNREDLAGIIAQIDRIAAIIHSQLDVVRPRKPELQPVDVAEVVGGLLPLVEHAGRRREVSVSSSVAAPLPLVLADPDHLKQVLLNLFVNALEATPAGGSVDVAAEPASHDARPGVRISVRDTGAGIAADIADKIFKPFFTTKPRGHGTGLGLAISRDIVKEHGGTLTVTSAAGAGATFAIWLPQAPDGAV